jgi:hypothetical protein
MTCRIPSCHGSTSPYGRYCNAHKIRHRRHGDPLQETITQATLKTSLKLLRDCIKKNSDKALWPKLEARWAETLASCRNHIAEARAGVIFNRDRLKASFELLKLDGVVAPRDVVEAVLAVFLLQEQEPRRFKSDRAFLFQLARRVRVLSEMNAGVYYNHVTGRMKRVYRDLKPAATEALGGILVESFGAAALYIARLITHGREQQAQAKQQMVAALQEIA